MLDSPELKLTVAPQLLHASRERQCRGEDARRQHRRGQHLEVDRAAGLQLFPEVRLERFRHGYCHCEGNVLEWEDRDSVKHRCRKLVGTCCVRQLLRVAYIMPCRKPLCYRSLLDHV